MTRRFMPLIALAIVSPRAVPQTPRERAENFEYVVNDTDKKSGTLRVLTFDLGGGVTMEVVRIKAGTFTMGSPEDEKDRGADETQRTVTISKDFYLGQFEVTQEQYEAVMGVNPSRFKGKKLPVESTSFDDAEAFCQALGKKLNRTVELPSEAQWEYACRGGTTTPYHFGTKRNGQLANTDRGKSIEVGQYKPNPFGLYDMHGNVKEAVADWYGRYDTLPATDPLRTVKPRRDERLLRGGSWFGNGYEARSAERVNCGHGPGFRAYDIGFRVILPIQLTR